MAMNSQYRTPDRYQFIKGAISEISDKHVAIWPYGETKELVSYFVHGVSEFWQGGLKYQHNLLGQLGDQGAVTTFRDDNGNRLVERLFVNDEQVRGYVEEVRGTVLIVRQDGRVPQFQSLVMFSFHPEAQMFDETPLHLSVIAPGQYVAGIGEIKGPNHLEVALLDVR